MKIIDGSLGEGGGQILRSSLSLAAVTGTEVEVTNIRAGRKKPGLLKQHLCAVKAARTICDGALEGAELGSRRVVLRPGAVRAGDHHFSVGSAGSATLVLQTVLPPLLAARAPSRVTVEGGTHNPAAPTFEFLERTFCPALAAMGARVEVQLERAGFYPTGGGRIVAEVIPPSDGWRSYSRMDRGALVKKQAVIVNSGLPGHVIRREREVLANKLGSAVDITTASYDAFGPGNAVIVELTYEASNAVFTGFGMRGKRAERVAGDAADGALAYMAGAGAVEEHLADQLLLPMALGAGGCFSAGPLSQHAKTNVDVIKRFLPIDVSVVQGVDRSVVVTVRPGA